MSEEKSDVRRQHRRVAATIPVRISTIESLRDPWTGKPYFRASQETCANVSRGGAFVRTTELLDPGRRILLELQLPNGSQVEAVGRVAWTKRSLAAGAQPDSGVGIEFLGGATEQLAALDDFLSRVEDRMEDAPRSMQERPTQGRMGDSAAPDAPAEDRDN